MTHILQGNQVDPLRDSLVQSLGRACLKRTQMALQLYLINSPTPNM
jgi:hypothetical protein